MGIKFANFAESKIASPPSGTTGLSFSVQAGQGAEFPALIVGDYFYGVFTNSTKTAFEVVKIDTRTADAFTIASGGRGLDGTTAQTWTANDYFYYGLTAIALQEALDHIADTSAAHAASAISNAPAGGIAATDVQGAINELDTEKAPKASPIITGSLTLDQGGGNSAVLSGVGVTGTKTATLPNATGIVVLDSATQTLTNKTHTNPAQSDQVLTDGPTLSWDMNVGAMASVTLGGNRTMAAPTNLKKGSSVLTVNQDATGSRTITWNALFKWPAGTAPVLSTAANAKDIISFVCDGTNLYGSFQRGFA